MSVLIPCKFPKFPKLLNFSKKLNTYLIKAYRKIIKYLKEKNFNFYTSTKRKETISFSYQTPQPLFKHQSFIA